MGLKEPLVGIDRDRESTGTEAERLELGAGSTPLDELLPPYGELTADDELGFLLETSSAELVIVGIEISGDDPGLPVTDIDCPDVVLGPYTGG